MAMTPVASNPRIFSALTKEISDRLCLLGFSRSNFEFHGDIILLTVTNRWLESHWNTDQTETDTSDLARHLTDRISRDSFCVNGVSFYLNFRSELLSTEFDRKKFHSQELFPGAVGYFSRPLVPRINAQARQEIYTSLEKSTALINKLRGGLAYLAYQPVFKLAGKGTGDVIYYEALLRTDNPESGTPSTGILDGIESLERFDLVSRLDRSVINSVVRDLFESDSVNLGCNLSAQCLFIDHWWKSIFTVLESRRDVASRLLIEITETSPIGDENEAIKLISKLQSLGVRIIIDDMGSGYSSTTFLAKSKADMVKIDRDVLKQSRDIHSSPELLRNLAKVCFDHCKTVILEGIENEKDMMGARYSGVNGIQGFLLAKPSEIPPWKKNVTRVYDACAYNSDRKFLREQ
jgi:EAL domain-containing protein (putative c-di-GMP-specific phosphodiesterase class I)